MSVLGAVHRPSITQGSSSVHVGPQVGAKGSLQGEVQSLDQSVALWVICRSVVEICAQQSRQGVPEGRSELSSAVRCDVSGGSETVHPFLKETVGAGVSHGGGEGKGLRPARGAVDACQEVGVNAGGREGSDDVNVDVGKGSSGTEMCWTGEW